MHNGGDVVDAELSLYCFCCFCLSEGMIDLLELCCLCVLVIRVSIQTSDKENIHDSCRKEDSQVPNPKKKRKKNRKMKTR